MIHAFWLKDRLQGIACTEYELERIKLPSIEAIETESALDDEEYRLGKQRKELISDRVFTMNDILERIAEVDRQRLQAWENECAQIIALWSQANTGQVDAAFKGTSP